MKNRARFFLSAAALLLAAAPAAAQAGPGAGIAAPCTRGDVPQSARDHCHVAAQAVASAQPQLGILIAGGNPTLGASSTAGLRLGVLPRVGAGLSASVVFVRIPEILAGSRGDASRIDEVAGIAAPALSGSASVALFGGFSTAPAVGGIGSIDLLGSAVWLPLSLADAHGFEDGSSELAYGAGVRIGVVRESFVTPGVSVSVMHRRLGEVAYGNVCPAAGVVTGSDEDGYHLQSGACVGEAGDAGEFSATLSDWSTRAMVGKRLGALGLAAGVGHDRFSSDIGYGFRAPEGAVDYYARVSGLDLDNSRWSAFVNGSLTLLVASIALEGGWMQGDDPIPGFPSASDFDPGDGTFFGSVGMRLAL